MIRYVTDPRAGYDPESGDSWDDAHGITVFEADDGPTDTGLVDHCGRSIYRLTERAQIGFQVRRRVRVKAGSRKV